jgi:dihydrofolate reductase
MQISLIAAVSKNGVIGKDSALPWHYPEDLKFFRQTTQDKVVIMGRKTFLSLNNKPLPKRLNIVLTRNLAYDAPGCRVAHSVDSALAIAREEKGNDQEVMVIGGADIYALFLPDADRLYLTVLNQDFEGDVFFPTVKWEDWSLSEEKPHAEFVIKKFDRLHKQG